MKKRPTKKPSGAIYRHIRTLEVNLATTRAEMASEFRKLSKTWMRRFGQETELRLEQNGKTHATFNQRANELERRIQVSVNAESIFDSKLRAIEARLTSVENQRDLDLASLSQRMAEYERLVAELTDRFTKRDPAPFGMTKHLHPKDQPCVLCATKMRIGGFRDSVSKPGGDPGVVETYQSCPKFPHTHNVQGESKWCGGIRPMDWP